MNNFSTLPAGVRLDSWPDMSTCQAPQDAPEVAQLREELRKAMPEFTDVLDTLAKLRHIQDLAGRLAGPAPVRVIVQKS